MNNLPINTKNLKEFETVLNMTDNSSILGVGNDSIGNGIKIKLSSLNNNLISKNPNNMITLDDNGKLFIEKFKDTTYHPQILSFMWSDHLLNDIQWLKADSFNWQDGNTYETAYNTLVEEYATGETLTEDGITFKKTTNYFRIANADQEQLILNKYNSQGVAWYYILDIPNKRFKLPRMKYKYWKNKNTLPIMGNGIGVTFTDGNKELSFGRISGGNYYGPTESNVGGAVGSSTSNISGSGNVLYGLTQDAAKSGIVADVSNATSELPMYLYFYVGEFAQSAIEQTAGLKAELFNNKLDINSAQAQAPYIKSTYENGADGYRIWSDGYCEQWGQVGRGTSSAVTITFLKTFKDTNYVVFKNNKIGTSDSNAIRSYSCYDKTETSFTTYNFNSETGGGGFDWLAKGYISNEDINEGVDEGYGDLFS